MAKRNKAFKLPVLFFSILAIVFYSRFSFASVYKYPEDSNSPATQKFMAPDYTLPIDIISTGVRDMGGGEYKIVISLKKAAYSYSDVVKIEEKYEATLFDANGKGVELEIKQGSIGYSENCKLGKIGVESICAISMQAKVKESDESDQVPSHVDAFIPFKYEVNMKYCLIGDKGKCQDIIIAGDFPEIRASFDGYNLEIKNVSPSRLPLHIKEINSIERQIAYVEEDLDKNLVRTSGPLGYGESRFFNLRQGDVTCNTWSCDDELIVVYEIADGEKKVTKKVTVGKYYVYNNDGTWSSWAAVGVVKLMPNWVANTFVYIHEHPVVDYAIRGVGLGLVTLYAIRRDLQRQGDAGTLKERMSKMIRESKTFEEKEKEKIQKFVKSYLGHVGTSVVVGETIVVGSCQEQQRMVDENEELKRKVKELQTNVEMLKNGDRGASEVVVQREDNSGLHKGLQDAVNENFDLKKKVEVLQEERNQISEKLDTVTRQKKSIVRDYNIVDDENRELHKKILHLSNKLNELIAAQKRRGRNVGTSSSSSHQQTTMDLITFAQRDLLREINGLGNEVTGNDFIRPPSVQSGGQSSDMQLGLSPKDLINKYKGIVESVGLIGRYSESEITESSNSNKVVRELINNISSVFSALKDENNKKRQLDKISQLVNALGNLFAKLRDEKQVK